MACFLRILSLIPFLISLHSFSANTVVKSTLDIEKSIQGQPIQLRIVVTTDSPSYVGPPKEPILADWEITQRQEIADVRTFESNGRLIRKNIKYFIYVLKPLRSGKVPVPGFIVSVGKNQFTTEEKIAIVEPFQNSPAPKLSNPFPTLPKTLLPDSDFFDAEDLGLGTQAPVDTSKKIMFQAEVDKHEVFVGEMIKVSFNLYRRNIEDINHDYKKFPVFDGFLKEDLYLPRTLSRRTVSIQGVPYQMTEFARFALFPLKEGLLTVDPFELRYEVVQLSSTGLGFGIQPIPQSISSESVKIFSKPLPPVPKEIQFQGSVGSFQWTVSPPPPSVPANQPFTLTVTISGQGNIKSIEAPKIDLPEGVENHGVKPFPKVNENSEGSMKFDYLFLPRTPGTLTLPAFTWGYFDPKKKQYAQLKHAPITITVSESGSPAAQNTATKASPKANFRPIQISKQAFSKINKDTSFITKSAWLALVIASIILGILFFIRSQRKENQAYLENRPWLLTETHILKQSDRSESRLASLLDQYIREYICGMLHDPQLTSKSPKTELLEALYQKLSPEHHTPVNELKNFFIELDHSRFAGKTLSKTNAKEPLQRVKAIFQTIEKTLKA